MGCEEFHEQMKSVLVTQSFGRESEYRRAIFMIWSFRAHTKRFLEVILFTDQPDYFTPYFKDQLVRYVLLTPERIKSMRGNIDFLHRMKIALIEEAFNICPDCDLIYADSDTFFVADTSGFIDSISPEISFMHTLEYAFQSLKEMPLPAGVPFRAFLKLIEDREFLLADGAPLKVKPDQTSWNAGVMFLHKSHIKFLPDVYALTDQFYPPTRNHASEQYAFSIVLQNRTKLLPCEEVVYHYWNRVKKNIMDDFLEKKTHTLLSNQSADKNSEIIKQWTAYLPGYLESHVWMLRDLSIQALNENKFQEGYILAARALLKNPIHWKFLKDIGYHFFRQIGLKK